MNIELIDIKTIPDRSGNLSIIESLIDLPIAIRRVFFIWNTGAKLGRGGHAHKELVQCFIAMHGSCELSFDDGNEKRTMLANDPSKCLIVQPGHWLDISSFSDDCVLMILASEHYDAQDYIRNYNEFLNYVKAKE